MIGIRKGLIKVPAAIIFSLLILIPVFSQKIEDGWKGLLPFKSTKADVENVLGKGKQVEDFLGYEYVTDEAVIWVAYTKEPCENTIYDIPAGTVLRYDVELKQNRPLSSFTFDTNRFDDPWPNRSASYFYYYRSREKLGVVPNESGISYGIWFEGEVIANREYVKLLHYRTPWSERDRNPCKKRDVK